MSECNHLAGYWLEDYVAWWPVCVGDVETDDFDGYYPYRLSEAAPDDVEIFNYCPKCGEKLPVILRLCARLGPKGGACKKQVTPPQVYCEEHQS